VSGLRGRALLGAALGIAGVTVLSRAVGFARVGVLSRTLGTSCVGSVYSAVNSLPNVVFEVAAGGALATLVVPLLAPAVDRGDRDTAGRTASALLSWAVLVLAPLAVLGALLARPVVRLLVGAHPACPDAAEVGSRLLVVFMPQVVLYGVGIVLAGVLQAHRRFLGPAVAPLLSSLVVITAYLLYAAQGRTTDLRALSTRQELTLSLGTTLGVAALSLCLLVPLRRTGLPLRPTLAFPPGVAARARGLAGAGLLGLAAQQLALLVALRLALGGSGGDAVVLAVATAVFLLPWSVLAVPVATSVFPLLAARAEDGDEAAFATVAGRALRAVLVLMLGSAALLAVVAGPAARVLVLGAPGVDSTAALAGAIRAFAPGLVGYGLLAQLGRALYARGDGRTPAAATVAGWAVAAVLDVVLVAALPSVGRVTALGLGNTLGMTLAGVLLLRGLARSAGPAALAGAGRAAGAGLAGAAVAVAVGLLLPVPRAQGAVGSLVTGGVLAVVAAAAYVAAVRLLDPAGVRELVRRG
jgi:putative peptidoglycan lipid II flippase